MREKKKKHGRFTKCESSEFSWRKKRDVNLCDFDGLEGWMFDYVCFSLASLTASLPLKICLLHPVYPKKGRRESPAISCGGQMLQVILRSAYFEGVPNSQSDKHHFESHYDHPNLPLSSKLASQNRQKVLPSIPNINILPLHSMYGLFTYMWVV